MYEGSDFGGTRGRQLMTVDLTRILLKYRTFSEPVPNSLPQQEAIASRIDFGITEIEITDLLPESTYNRFLCYDDRELRIGRRPMFRLSLEGTIHQFPYLTPARPPNKTCTKVSHELKVSLLPLCLHMDQDALIFFLNYLYEAFGMNEAPKEEGWVDVPTPPRREEGFFFGIFPIININNFKPRVCHF